MVSKVAVIALVAIVACPILLGYAMNLEQVTETDYIESSDVVNVTQLLQTGVSYNYTKADLYQLNSVFKLRGALISPYYEKYTDINTSIKLSADKKIDGYRPAGTFAMSNYDYWGWLFDYNSDVGYVSVTLTDTNALSQTFNKIHTIYVDYSTNTVYMTYYTNGYTISSSIYTFSNISTISFTTTTNYYADNTYQWYDRTVDSKYVDISAGYHFTDPTSSIILADYSKSYLLTINLDSITDPSYDLVINTFTTITHLVKSTTDGVVTWVYDDGYGDVFELYYDQTRNDNTYQIFEEMTYLSQRYDAIQDENYYTYATHSEYRYVGGWPTIIGEANPYITYTRDHTKSVPESIDTGGLSYINFSSQNQVDRFPTVRLDSGSYRAVEYYTIKDKTYSPASFKTNPSTIISDIRRFGSAITFGGNTYNVTNGNITLGTHQVSVSNLVMDSVPAEGGGYNNRINGSIISTTAQPSTITFVGEWGATIKTASLDVTTKTSTEWQAGSFGWDGIDHNFLIVGLLTSFGAFIALGIYMRRTKASLWPLLIVCGGAAVLFFVML